MECILSYLFLASLTEKNSNKKTLKFKYYKQIELSYPSEKRDREEGCVIISLRQNPTSLLMVL